MKKILFFIHDLGGGGAEKILVNLANHLDQKKFDITIIALFGNGVNEQFLSPHIHFSTVFSKAIPGNSKLMKLLSPRQLHRLFVRNTYDIEIAFLEGPSARIISGCNTSNSKTVSWIHGQQNSKEIAARAFRSYKESLRCYACFDKIVCVSETVREDFSSIYPTIKKPVVCYNAIDSDSIHALMKEPIRDTVFRSDEVNLVAVGRIIPQKGFDRLARIIKRLKDDGLPVHLYVLGDGAQRKQIDDYLQENNIHDAYTFLGYQINPYKYVSKCDLFVCASWREGFSTATMEAMITGIPICTVEVSGMKEMLGENNEFGIITKNDENDLYLGIKEMLQVTGKLSYYKKQARIRGEMFQMDKAIEKVEEMLYTL